MLRVMCVLIPCAHLWRAMRGMLCYVGAVCCVLTPVNAFTLPDSLPSCLFPRGPWTEAFRRTTSHTKPSPAEDNRDDQEGETKSGQYCLLSERHSARHRWQVCLCVCVSSRPKFHICFNGFPPLRPECFSQHNPPFQGCVLPLNTGCVG